MDNTKVRLTVLGIQGTPKRYKPRDYSQNPGVLKRMFGDNIHVVSGKLFREYTSDFCSHSLSITRDAYISMTDGNNRPYWYKAKNWGRLSATQRLEAHLDTIAREKGGLCYIYNLINE